MRAKRRFTLAHDLEIGVVTRHVGRGPATKDPPVPIALDRRSYALPRAGATTSRFSPWATSTAAATCWRRCSTKRRASRARRPRRVVVLLGDLVDRGPDSLGAIDIGLDGARRAGGDETIALMGNHEAMMRLALDPQTPPADAIDALETWIANGGDHTLGEFVHFTTTPADLEDLLRDARESLPPRVGDWLANLKSHWRSGGLLFVHAGVNPGVDLESFLAEPWNAPLRRWAATSTGPGCAGRSFPPRRDRKGTAAISSSTAIRPTTSGRIRRRSTRSAVSASISTPVR